MLVVDIKGRKFRLERREEKFIYRAHGLVVWVRPQTKCFWESIYDPHSASYLDSD